MVEKGESPLQGARRELREETTIDDIKFTWGQEFTETEPYSYGKVARYYLAEVFQKEIYLPINPILNRAEHHEFRWCHAQEAQTFLGPRLRKVLHWAQSQSAPCRPSRD